MSEATAKNEMSAENAPLVNDAAVTKPASLAPGIEISEKAVIEIKRIQAKESSAQESFLRVMVAGGGCSGMSYKLGFENEQPKGSDKIFEKDGVKVVIDAKSLLFLAGTELDFSDGLNGTGFTFKNPNAKRTCGCGSSFSV